jgi:hypothetical protein
VKLTIPKTFELAGRTWTVKWVGKRSWYGRCKAAKCLIELSRDCNDEEALHAMGKEKLYNDEHFVDAHSALLLQALKTAK